MGEVRLDLFKLYDGNLLDKTIDKDIENHIKQAHIMYLQKAKDYQKTLELYREGFGISKISQILNCPRATIESWIYRGMKPVYRPQITKALIRQLKSNKLTYKEIANLFGVKPKTIYYGYIKPNKKTGKQFLPSKDTTEFLESSKNPVEFLNYIWKEVSGAERKNFEKFCKFVKLKDSIPSFELANRIGKSYSTVSKWKRRVSAPILLRWLELYLKFGKPKENHKWLFINLDINNTPLSRPIEVPEKIDSWNYVKNVIKQLKPLNDGHFVKEMSKEECLGFILGMIVGDAGKHGINKDSIHLAFSKRYESNKNLGEFFCQCLRKLGFKARRIKDYKNSYKWISQSSPFFNWIYTVALGLKITENTTFHPIKAKWILNSPKNFIKRFLQGIFESDGSVSYEAGITCACFPNNELIKSLLNYFDVKPYFVPIKDGKWELLELGGVRQLKKLHNIIFVPELKTIKYQIIEKILNADKVNGTGGRLPSEIKNKIIDLIKRDYKIYKIIKRILLDNNFYVSRNTIEHYIGKEVTKNSQERNDRKDR